MDQSDFVAQNDLELTLLNLMDGKMDGEDFLQYLLDAQVYMPLLDETQAIKGFQHSTKTQPLLIADEDDTQMLILFTSPGRAKKFVADFPGFDGGLLTDFSWVLRKMNTPLAIALNPGLEAGFDMDAATVADLKAHLPAETQ